MSQPLSQERMWKQRAERGLRYQKQRGSRDLRADFRAAEDENVPLSVPQDRISKGRAERGSLGLRDRGSLELLAAFRAGGNMNEKAVPVLSGKGLTHEEHVIETSSEQVQEDGMVGDAGGYEEFNRPHFAGCLGVDTDPSQKLVFVEKNVFDEAFGSAALNPAGRLEVASRPRPESVTTAPALLKREQCNRDSCTSDLYRNAQIYQDGEKNWFMALPTSLLSKQQNHNRQPIPSAIPATLRMSIEEDDAPKPTTADAPILLLDHDDKVSVGRQLAQQYVQYTEEFPGDRGKIQSSIDQVEWTAGYPRLAESDSGSDDSGGLTRMVSGIRGRLHSVGRRGSVVKAGMKASVEAVSGVMCLRK
ncbi:hypothetical protein N0V83_005913 [Neocucurbitaria cava]|uniref:Uncharacterized protein n=1 Tax=Neocucurbitaria cava TaxID=798079 RepID=A0A9W8Y713_9PLEO|nr:hypothetical protein N0V83_005913 [Neocucurbitaria cava]